MEHIRSEWLSWMDRIIAPVLDALAEGRLRERMPVEHHASLNDREQYTYLEAFGRTVTGIAPWLALRTLTGPEETVRAHRADQVRRALRNACDPASPDCMNFSEGQQPIVDAAFLAQGLLRAWDVLWVPLDPEVQRMVIAQMKHTRTRKPSMNNWLLFSAIIEAFLHRAGEPDWDPMRVDFALRQHEQWYLGDGMYSDGPHFHFDYYNSFVIQPMLLDVLDELGGMFPEWTALSQPAHARATRYAAILEQLIAPDGTFPIIGRSSAYRFGAFQSLCQAALQERLPEGVHPAQVRCGLTAVLRRMTAFGSMFDANGWLTIGVCGHQPAMGDYYISTGSLYLCSVFFLPLGLAPAHPFWAAPAEPWTSVRRWAGENTPADHGC